MTELNSIINGTEIPFKLNNDEQEFDKLFGKGAEGSYRSTYQFDTIADAKRGGYRNPQGRFKPPVPFGQSKAFLWGESVEPIKPSGYRQSGSNADPNTIPQAVLVKTHKDLTGQRLAEAYTASNAYVRYIA